MTGINRDSLQILRVDWPSLRTVGGLAPEPNVGAIVVRIENKRSTDPHRVFVDIREGLRRMPVAYLLNPGNRRGRYILGGGHSYATYDRSQRNIPGTSKLANWICQGDFEHIYLAQEASVSARFGSFLNHIASVLNS